jgi:outer membrane usher protein
MQSRGYRRGRAAIVAGVLVASGSVGAVSVSLTNTSATSAQVELVGAPEPILSWSGRRAPYRVALIFEGPQLALSAPLPYASSSGPIRHIAMRDSPAGSKLEIEVSQDVVPRLTRSRGGWILNLEGTGPLPPASAPPAPVPARAPAPAPALARENFLLDVQVNGVRVDDVVPADRLPDGRLVMADSAWRKARLRPPSEAIPISDSDTPGRALEAAPGVQYKLDGAKLQLEITAAPEAFDHTDISMRGERGGAPVPAAPGAYLNYDFAATSSDSSRTYAGLVEAVASNSWGSVSTGVAIAGGDRSFSQVRTETYARKDWPGTMEALVIGDSISSAGAWSRPVRFGGVHFGRDFSLAPGFITMPLPAISGSAALPSTIDVLVNSQKQSSTSVQPGPFALTNVPVVNGAGDLNIVVRDLRGIETVITQGFYVSPALLAEGLSDFSVEAGAMRERFGASSNEYGSAFVSGTYRTGVSPDLTVGARAEVQRSRQAVGVEAQGLVANWALAQGAIAVSHDAEAGTGFRTLAAAERLTRRGSASLVWEHFSDGFREFGVSELALRPKDRLRLGAGWRLFDAVTLGLSYARQTMWNAPTFSLVGANLGMNVGGYAFVSLFAAKQNGEPGWSAGVNVIVPLEQQRTASASASSRPRGGSVGTVQLTQAAPQGPGLGWSVRAGSGSNQAGQGSVVLNTNSAQFTADIEAGRGSSALRVGANGSVGWLDGQVFASRRIDQGAFAIVTVGNLEGVKVSRSNQVVATTDSHGRAVVTGLLPYQANQLTVDAAEIPLDVEVRGARESLVPYARSGNKVAFDVHRSRNVLVVLVRPDGSAVPAGTRVRLSGSSDEFIVATRGEVYLMDLPDGDASIEVTGAHAACRVALPVSASTPAESRIGPLVCGAAP